MDKLFTFSAESFSLHSDAEAFLRTNGAIFMDSGSFAYVRSELVPSLLLGLLGRADEANRNEISFLKSELEKFAKENTVLKEKVNLLESQFASADKQESGTAQGSGVAEHKQLLGATSEKPLQPMSDRPSMSDLHRSNEKLREELQCQRGQSIDALASLKVLEEENEELRRELDESRKRSAKMTVQ